ncbi:hypothetical protein L1887_22356 [Cichorium endivia]|nr:hypothetical protein L1887_22356 [Cichorium endivia]
MTPISFKQYTDDVSLLMVLIDTNPLFWSSTTTHFSLSKFLSQVLSFLNSIILLNQLNQVVVIATGFNSCDYIYDSSLGHANQRAETLLQKLEEFVVKYEQLNKEDSVDGIRSSLLSGYISMILCLHGSQDGPGQSQHSALLQQLKSYALNDTAVNMEEQFSQLTLDVIGLVVLNYNFYSLTVDSPVIESVYTALKEAEAHSTDLLPYWKKERRKFRRILFPTVSPSLLHLSSVSLAKCVKAMDNNGNGHGIISVYEISLRATVLSVTLLAAVLASVDIETYTIPVTIYW